MILFYLRRFWFLPVAALILCVQPNYVEAAEPSVLTTLTDFQLRALLGAHSKSQLRSAVDEFDRIKSLRVQCDVQLSGKKIPSACFAVLTLEVQTGLITGAKASEQERWLTPVCMERGKSGSDFSELERLQEAAALPAACARVIKERSADLRYSAEVEDPSRLFMTRLKGPGL